MSEFNSKSTQNQHGNYELEPCPFVAEQKYMQRYHISQGNLEYIVQMQMSLVLPK